MYITRYRLGRIVGVTLGLTVAGAAFGALAGVVATEIVFAVAGLDLLEGSWILVIPGFIGAILGGILAPLTAWCLLRRVPLGRMFRALTAGTIIGALFGFFIPVFILPERAFYHPIVAAVMGFLTTAVILRARYAAAKTPAR